MVYHQIEQIGFHMQARTYIRAMLEVFNEGRRCVCVQGGEKTMIHVPHCA